MAYMIRILIQFLVYCFIACLLCDIEPGKEYTWYSGIWHGLYFTVNFVRSLFTDALYKAEIYTTAYNIFYWIFSILSVLAYLLGVLTSSRRIY